MVKVFFSIAVLICSFSELNAQIDHQVKTESSVSTEEGTYQIITSGSKHERVFTTEMISSFKIEENRKENEDVFIEINPSTKIFIPSLNSINALGFQKLTTVIHE
jgi:hypothetical protein